MDLEYLAPKIYAILTAPAVDLSTISAKRVRKQLIADGEPEDVLRQRKTEVDAIIAQIYESVNNPPNASPAGHGGALASGGMGGNGDPGAEYARRSSPAPQHKRKRSPSLEPSYNFQSSQPQPLQDVKRGGTSNGSRGGSQVKTDAELARQLSFELNARSTRAGASSNGGSRTSTPKNRKTKPTGKKGSAKKSKATIDSDDDGEDDDGAAPRAKKKAKGGGGGGFQKEYVLSDVLADLFGGQKMASRPQAVKKLWDHIKSHNLQDPSDKREILCDDPLKAVFRTDRLNMFKMNKLLGDHLAEPGEQVQ